MTEKLQTYREWLNWGANTLKKAGNDAPRQEARWLLLSMAGLDPVDLIRLDTQLFESQEILERFKEAIQRRTRHEPLAHIEGHIEFYGLTFKSDARALIPRSDSETLINVAMAYMPEDEQVSIADLGTGSGCLLLTLLHLRPKAIGQGVDQSVDAIALAMENVRGLELSTRATLFPQSWADWDAWSDMDLIVSNPPYIESGVIASLDPDVRLFDPMDALDGGNDGLDAYREIISLAAAEMQQGARLVL